MYILHVHHSHDIPIERILLLMPFHIHLVLIQSNKMGDVAYSNSNRLKVLGGNQTFLREHVKLKPCGVIESDRRLGLRLFWQSKYYVVVAHSQVPKRLTHHLLSSRHILRAERQIERYIFNTCYYGAFFQLCSDICKFDFARPLFLIALPTILSQNCHTKITLGPFRHY